MHWLGYGAMVKGRGAIAGNALLSVGPASPGKDVPGPPEGSRQEKSVTVRAITLLALLACCNGNVVAQVTSQANVYKIGAHRSDGSRVMGSAVQVSPGKMITSCHTVRDTLRIVILHFDSEIAGTLEKADVT